MKQRVIFLFYHGLGHVTAIFKLARTLEQAGHEIYFAGVGYFQHFVLTQGFKFYVLASVPFGYGFEKWSNAVRKKKLVYLSTLRDRITDRLYKKREAEFFWMLESIKPSVIFIDSRQATDFILLYQYLRQRSIKVALLQAMLPMDVTLGHPPINSDVFPGDEAAVRKALRMLKVKQIIQRCKGKFMYLGYDDHYIIRRRLKKACVPDHYIFRTTSLLNFSVRNVDEFIITPREFDFPEFTPTATQHFVGFMTNEVRNEMLEPDYNVVSRSIFDLKDDKNLKLLYCSFGTIEPKRKSSIHTFLQKLFNIARQENYILIVSLKANQATRATLNPAGNIYVFNSVPQLEVLYNTDVFITHGGINSIKEAIHAEVPMLLYPVHREYDHIGNAARVDYHGLGLRGEIETDTQADIAEKINALISNPVYKKKVCELKEKDSRYTPEKFLEQFNAIKPLEI